MQWSMAGKVHPRQHEHFIANPHLALHSGSVVTLTQYGSISEFVPRIDG